MTRILVFGDSIAYGAWDSQGGWADRLKRDLHQMNVPGPTGKKFQLINLGIGGDTSEGVARRITSEIVARCSASWEFTFVLAIGINDSRTNDGLPEKEETEYADNLKTIIAALRQYTGKILLVGLTPVAHEELAFKKSVYHQSRIRQYNSTAKDVAAQQGATFIDVFEAALSSPLYMQSLGDGLHPGEAGHQFLYESIRPELFKMIRAHE